MGKTLDPHHLVALMSYLHSNDQDKDSVINQPQPTSFNFPLLDAIAGISVSQERSQVVAVAIQLNSKKRQIRLIIAENQVVDQKILFHLTDIWTRLQILSKAYAAQGGSFGGVFRMPAIHENVGRKFRLEIFQKIILFSLPSYLEQVNKWWDTLYDFTMELVERCGDNPQGFELDLCEAVAALDTVIQFTRKLPHCLESRPECQVAFSASIFATQKAKIIFAGSSLSSKDLAPGYLNGEYSKNSFCPQHALKQLTDLFTHIDTLFEFAHSPYQRSLMQYRMLLVPIAPQLRTVMYPANMREWQSILGTAATTDLRCQRQFAEELSENFLQGGTLSPVHPELALIEYLCKKDAGSSNKIPPFSYIAVSELSCAPCRLWIEAYNQLGPRRFHTRGIKDKWCWPWAMPFMSPDLVDIMTSKLSQEYITYLKKRAVYFRF